MRVNQYEQLLPQGTTVRPAMVPPGRKTPSLVCKNPSWLLFIDLKPAAHFAHPVQIVLLDAVTGEQRTIDTDWWPQIDSKEIFNTLDARTNRATIIFDKCRPPRSRAAGPT